MKHVESLRGLEVVVSGDFRQSLGLQKDELVRQVRRVGAAHVGTDVRSTTDLFVRGASALYKYGKFGDKEAELAARVPDALVIDSAGVAALLNGEPAPAWPPNSAPIPRKRLHGLPYRDGTPRVTDPVVIHRDPDLFDRGLKAHRRVLGLLAERVDRLGWVALEGVNTDCLYDLAWEADDTLWVAEVKSLTAENERHQLRLGLGQVLDYRDWLGSQYPRIQAVLAVERKPTLDRWNGICESNGVILTWPNVFSRRVG